MYKDKLITAEGMTQLVFWAVLLGVLLHLLILQAGTALTIAQSVGS